MADVITEFLEHYTREYEFYDRLSAIAARRCGELLRQTSTRTIVTNRAKAIDRLREKLLARNAKQRYASVAEIYDDIVDLSGVRIALYFPSEQKEVGQLIRESFTVVREKSFPEMSTRSYQAIFPGYKATHFHVTIKPEDLAPTEGRFAGHRIEIQVASVLMHAWSEVEHDLAYKPLSGTLSDDEAAVLDELNGLVLAGEIALQRLLAARDRRIGEPHRSFEHYTELSRYLYQAVMRRFPELKDDPILGRTDILFEFLREVKCNEPAAVDALLDHLAPSNDALPLTDQLIDLILAEHPKQYAKYKNIRKRLLERSPFRTADESPIGGDVLAGEQALTLMWILFERALRELGASVSSIKAIGELAGRKAEPKLSASDIEQLRQARNIRNRVVHGYGFSDPTAVAEATASMRDLLKRLSPLVSPTLQREIDKLTD